MNKDNSILFNKFPVIKSERLLLTEIKEENHLRDFYELRTQEESAKHSSFEPYTSFEQIYEYLKMIKDDYQTKESIYWGIIEVKSDKLIGYIRMSLLSEVMISLGYALNKNFWHQGYASEAVKAAIGFVYRETNINRFQATVTLNNFSSIKLLERLNFAREGVMRERVFWKNEFKDLYMYALIKRDWK